MSREVLDGAEPGTPEETSADPARPPAAPPGPRSPAVVTDLDAPTIEAAPAAGPESSSESTAARDELARPRQGATPAGAPTPGAAPAWLRTRWAVTAAAAAGALVAGLVTGGVLERRYEEERMQATPLVVDFAGDTRRSPGERLVNTTLVVVNTGRSSVRLVEAAFDRGGTTIALRQSVTVPAGETVRVPVQLEFDCRGPAPRRLELTVRTPDGRTRMTEPHSVAESISGAGLLDTYWQWVCDTSRPTLEIWSPVARDDGTLAFRIRNPTDVARQVEFRGPAGTRIVSDPAAPFSIGSRDGEYVSLAVEVERCTAAAQRANAVEDLSMIVDGEDIGAIPTDVAVLAGWLARSVALQCS